MPTTPNRLLEVLDFITLDAAPHAEMLSVHSGHIARVRKTFDDPNIVGVGIGKKVTAGKQLDRLCICFYVVKKKTLNEMRADNLIPPVLATNSDDAVFTDVKAVGQIVPQVKPLVKQKPIESAYSVGHVDITAGTLGAIVALGSKRCLLSNSHVLANSGQGRVGDRILYPGPLDGGVNPSNWIASLSKAVPFKAGGSFVNRVNAALAEVRKERLAQVNYAVSKVTLPFEIAVPQRDMVVTKRGRTTRATKGKVIDVDFRFILNYDGVGKVGFTGQVLCERYTDGGDSGSLVVEERTGKVVGLHFAGAEGGSVFNPIQSVIKELGFTFTSS